jgi:hypothetical protein
VGFHEKALAVLEEALAEANKRADAALALADRTLAQLAAAGGRADRLELDLATALDAANQARREAQAAQDAADALRRADDARKARGLMARLRAALRGSDLDISRRSAARDARRPRSVTLQSRHDRSARTRSGARTSRPCPRTATR